MNDRVFLILKNEKVAAMVGVAVQARMDALKEAINAKDIAPAQMVDEWYQLQSVAGQLRSPA